MEQGSEFDSHESRQRTNALLGIYALLVITVTCIIAFSDSWPITYFQEITADSHNMYPVKLVFMMTLLAVGIVLFPFYWLVKMAFDRKRDHEFGSTNSGILERDKKSFSFEYAAAVSTITMDNQQMEIKTGFVKRLINVSQLKHFYLVSKNNYHTLYITYEERSGKVKKVAMNAEVNDPELLKFVKEMSEQFPSKSLNHLSEKEAYRTMQVTNPMVIVVIILLVVLSSVGAAIFFALQSS